MRNTITAKKAVTGLLLLIAMSFVLIATPALAETTGPPAIGSFEAEEVDATHAKLNGGLEAHGSDAHWRIEYAISQAGPWILAASGTAEPISSGEFFKQAAVAPEIHHLTASNHYFARLIAENESGESSKTIEFTTTGLSAPEIRNLHSIEIANRGVFEVGPFSANLEAEIETNGSETDYHFEYATSESGPWTPVAGAGGSITTTEDFVNAEARVTGLSPETTYFVRVTATSKKGTVESTTTIRTTPAVPQPGVRGFSEVTASSANVGAGVDPDGSETQWHLESATGANGPWAPVPGASGTISQTEAADYEVHETPGELTGLASATTYYLRLFAENKYGETTSRISSFETAGPPVVATFAVHAFQGESTSVLGSVEPHGFEARYHFEYVTQEHFGAEGFANPSETPQLDAGGGGSEESGGNFEEKIVSQSIAGLRPGETYHYRLVATNTAVGDPVVYGEDQTLTAPQPLGPSPSSCPNESFRTGPSALLPDCRAYEQITPVKKSAYDLFAHAGTVDQLTPADDGERAALHTIAQLGPNPGSQSAPGGHGAGNSYVLSRTVAGWQLASVYPPEAGDTGYNAEIFSPDLSQVGVQSSNFTTFFEHTGGLGMLSGPPGGPYTTVANVAVDDGFVKSQEAPGTEFYGADASFTHLLFSSIDHSLAPAATGGLEDAPDLYEYSGGQISLVNVSTAGSLLNSCGAALGYGRGIEGDFANNAVSADGSKVFFTSPAPQHPGASGPSCDEPPQLYMRQDGVTTEISAPAPGVVDPAGPQSVVYLGASADGSKIFFRTQAELTLDDLGIHDEELYEYDTETAKLTRISHGDSGTAAAEVDTSIAGHPFVISEDGSTVYFKAKGQLTPEAPQTAGQAGGEFSLYRYDTLTGETAYVATVGPPGVQQAVNEATPDGRFLLFESTGVLGVDSPGGKQLYRYDSADRSITCVSCGKTTDGEVTMPEQIGTEITTPNSIPQTRAISEDGSYVFFATTAALASKDVNEATDVYEWHEGVLSLLSGGRDPHGSEFFGEAANGRDVFFSSNEQLAPSDTDDQGDAYDARIGGGFPPPPPAVAPCEGDACSAPFTAPVDATPSSFTFHGAGDTVAEMKPPTVPEVKSKAKEKIKTKRKAKKKTKQKGKSKQKGKKVNAKRAVHRHRGGAK